MSDTISQIWNNLTNDNQKLIKQLLQSIVDNTTNNPPEIRLQILQLLFPQGNNSQPQISAMPNNLKSEILKACLENPAFPECANILNDNH